MANNYTLFSEKIEGLTPEAAAWVETVLDLDPEKPEDLEKLKKELSLESDDPRFFEELDGWPYFECKITPTKYGEGDECPVCKCGTIGLEGNRLVCRGECGQFVDILYSLWLYSEEALKDDHLIWFVQALINKFMPDYIFRVCFACTCSKPRIGEFGGYWIVVSKDRVESGSTWDAADEATKAIEPMSNLVRGCVRRIEEVADHILTDTNTEPEVLAEALRRLAASVEERES